MAFLTSFPDGFRALVVGATGGVGAALIAHLLASPKHPTVYGASRSGQAPDGAIGLTLDLTDPASIEQAVALASADGPLHLVVVATGILHDSSGRGPEKSTRQIQANHMAEVFAINTIGPALVLQSVMPHMARGSKSIPEKAVFAALSARVGSISDNRLGGWHSYRASKAALNQVLKTSAIEWARKYPHAVCIGLHPGTVDTRLSKPFQGNVAEGKLFSPAYSAERLLTVIDEVGPAQSGKVFDWAGEEIPA